MASFSQQKLSLKGDDFFRQVATQPPFSKMDPAIAAFFKEYLSNEKATSFNGRFVVNTHFPPYPSRAFDNLASQFGAIGETGKRQLYSVTLAVTNRCMYRCWHCYNAGRNQRDMPLSRLKELIAELQDMNAVRVTLSGGEPLLRNDLEEIAGSFDDRTYLNLNTTGRGLTLERARALKESGVFAAGVSIDSTDPGEHDRLRGRAGAFETAVQALKTAEKSGLYPYIVTVATHEFLKPERFMAFLRFAGNAGAREVHLLEPCATGKLAGNQDVLLSRDEKDRILAYQKEIAADFSLPILSSFLYLESPEAFGCGAGITHLYIDGSGEVCPCNLVPLSFGNIQNEPLRSILDRMGAYFCKPRTRCVGQTLTNHITGGHIPADPQESCDICEKHLPREHPIPRFFEIKSRVTGGIGKPELKSAYDAIHQYYDEFWVSEAGRPVVDLLDRLSLKGHEHVLEAGCGTGFATVLIANRLHDPGRLTAVDLSDGMLGEARKRAESAGIAGIRFVPGDALEILNNGRHYDLIFSSWVLGYIPLKPFFAAASRALLTGGRLAFVVHKENSPREPLSIFGELVAQDPSILMKKVAFDFPRDMNHVASELACAGLHAADLREGQVTFRYRTADEVLEHLLKSGAGTAYYEAVDPGQRESQKRKFVKTLEERRGSRTGFDVIHDYIVCIAEKA